MGRHVLTPFELAFDDGVTSERLRVDTVLRIVPGKRLVAKAQWRGETIIAKLFFGRSHWKQNLLRDLRGVTQLREAGILTPRVVGQYDASDKGGNVLLFDYLRDATSLLDLFAAAGTDEERGLIVEMGIASIVQCHEAGLYQRDLHLDNFMLSGGKVYVLDGYDIRQAPAPLERGLRLTNLGLFFAQMPVDMDVNIPRWLDHYRRLTNAFDDDVEVELMTAVRTARLKRLTIIENKLFRSSTATRLVQSRTRLAVYDRTLHSPALEALIADPDTLLARGTLLKDGGASTVALIKFEGRDYVLKRYNIKGFVHGLKRLFRPSRAHKSWRSAATLLALGIATPRPCLFVEERLLWVLRRRAWFLCEYVPGINLLEQLQPGEGQVSRVLAEFRHLFHVMREYNVSHGDMKASNFIYHNDRLYVLDLDATQRHPTSARAEKSLQKDIDRFRRNWSGTELEQPVQAILDELRR